MNRIRILVANEPRTYRQVISCVLGNLKPDAEVIATEPEDLDREILRFTPHLVVCSQATPAVRSNVPAWVELYPNGASGAVIGLAGEHTMVADVQFDTLLSTVDRVELLY